MSRSRIDNLPPILSVGTAVVTRVEVRGGDAIMCPAGAVGRIEESPADPEHSYRVRLTGGELVSLRRRQIAVLKHFQRNGMEGGVGAMDEYDLQQYVIYRCIVGSRAYGLDHEASDTDTRGVYLPPAEMHWSLAGVPEQLENKQTDECYWELGKFVRLALKANPNVLEVLYSPLVEHVEPTGRELLNMRASFLSKLVYQTYNGYVMSQFRKLEADMRNRGQIKWKHAMHLVRLLISGITVLGEAAVPVEVVATYRDRLLAVRDGLLGWDEVNAWRLDLHQQFDGAFAETALAERPDYDAANAFLIKARRSMVK